MIFLDPTSDLAFKKLFGNAAHKNILIDFLNAVLERKPGEKIVDVVFNDPYNTPETPLSKLSIASKYAPSCIRATPRLFQASGISSLATRTFVRISRDSAA